MKHGFPQSVFNPCFLRGPFSREGHRRSPLFVRKQLDLVAVLFFACYFSQDRLDKGVVVWQQFPLKVKVA